ncbi:MAG: DNA-3-methyladenine glycosylase [Gemmataceae bacterium]
MAESSDPHAAAKRHIQKHCPVLGPHVKRFGPCKLVPNPDSFAMLCRSIISQQISTKAADSIRGRTLKLLGGKFTPKRFAKVSDDELRSCGLSAGKVKFLRDLVARVEDGTVPIRKLPAMENDEVRERLIVVKGIGPWTVDMFLMFSLGRPDVLPVGDLGIRAAVKKLWTMNELPTPSELTEIAEPWRPYRTVASWYLWRTIEPENAWGE